MPKAIIVLGMHRSGTSMVAELAEMWGAFGNDNFLPVDSRNPQGYWEYAPLVHFNRRLLLAAGSESFVPPSDEDLKRLEEWALESVWRDEASQLIAGMESGNRVWYWKDPRLAVMLPFWQKIWGDVVYVVTVREPLDTALSLKKRDTFPTTAGHLMWQRYMTAILKDTDAHPHRIFVQYERILAQPLDECRRLCDFLDQHCPLDDRQPPEKRVESMLKAVNPNLRSHASDGGFFSSPEVSEGQKNLYRYLHARALSLEECLAPDVFDIYPGWRDYLRSVVTLKQVRAALRKKERPLRVKIKRKLLDQDPPPDPLPW